MEAVQIRLVEKQLAPAEEAAESIPSESSLPAQDVNNTSGQTTLDSETNEQDLEESAVGKTESKGSCPDVQVAAHSQDIGWADYVSNGDVAGTTGRHLRLEGVKMRLVGASSGSIEYQSHVAYEGWQDFEANDAMSGTVGRAHAIEAIMLA